TAKQMVKRGEVPRRALSTDGLVVGYAQFVLTIDKVLHSYSIRVSRKFKGQGIGERLHAERVRLAKAAGARIHFYAVDPAGEVALQKIVVAQGMHRCFSVANGYIFAQSLEDEAPVADEAIEPAADAIDDIEHHRRVEALRAAPEMGYSEPEWECDRHGEGS